MTDLARHVDDLLQHAQPAAIAPDFVTVAGPRGGYGVALVLDGYYSTERDAADMVPLWRESLRRVLADLAKVDPYSDGPGTR